MVGRWPSPTVAHCSASSPRTYLRPDSTSAFARPSFVLATGLSARTSWESTGTLRCESATNSSSAWRATPRETALMKVANIAIGAIW